MTTIDRANLDLGSLQTQKITQVHKTNEHNQVFVMRIERLVKSEGFNNCRFKSIIAYASPENVRNLSDGRAE